MTTKNSYHTIYIVDCSGRNLHRIPQELPYNSTKLDGNDFGHLHNGSVPMYNTKVLYLNNSQITAIDEGFFAAYPYLVALYLDHNELKVLPDEMFTTLDSINTMYLHNNLLEKVNMDMLRNATLEVQIQRITLFNNPWKCDCSFGLGFKEWIENNLDIVENKNDIKCGSVKLPIVENSTLNYTFLENATMDNNSETDPYSNNDFKINTEKELPESIWKVDFTKCHERNITVENPVNRDIIIISSVLGVTFLILVCVGILLYWKRELIMVWLYNNPKTNWFWRPKEEVNQLDYKSFRTFRMLWQCLTRDTKLINFKM